MASEVTALISTKETANYARLCRLLVDVGTQVLRTTFDKVYQPENLGTFLSRKPIHSVLLSLRKKQVLNTHQWGKLYPQSLVSSQHFDITLVMVLLKNICGLVPPTSGWDLPPPTENTTPEADIVRITYYRDTVYSYARGAAVDDKTFNLYWKDISNVLVRLGGTCYQNAINSIKTECMDSHFEKHYRELLKNWFQDDDTIKKREGRAEGKLEATRLELTMEAVVTKFKSFKKKFVARISSKSEKSTEIIRRNREKGHLDGAEGKINRTQPNKKFCKDERSEGFAGARDVRMQGRSVGEKKINRLQSKDVYLAKEKGKVIEKIVLALERAINYHQIDQIADARNALRSLFVVLLNIQLQDLEVPNEDGWLWEVLAWGKELFLEGGVSCSIKHGTLLLDSSYVGQKYLQEKIRSSPINQVSSPNDSSIPVEEFYLSVLNVLGAFALLISELEIAHETFELLVDFHHQLATSNSPLQDLGAAYNNKGCISLVKGDFCLATEEFKKSLSYVESRKLRQLERLSTDTESVAVYSNISRLHLISRNFNEALELQEQLENDCEAREINELPFQTIFMMMNNRVVLYTSLGNFNKAEKALRRLKSYCNRMEREDCNSLLNFVRLHLCEALLLQGKTREAEEELSLKKLSSTSFTDLVDMFGSLYMNVRIEALEKLAEIFVRRGQIQIALSLLEKTVEIIETSFGSDHLNLASLLFKQGSILSLTGDLTSAAGKFKSSADILQMIFGQGNPLLIKCYMSLGELKSRLEHKEESRLYFQRAVKSLEVLYHVSFENELSTTYMEITKKLKKSSRSEVSEMMIEGLVAEHGQALAVLLRENNPQEEALRRSKTGKKLVSGERLENECLDSKIVISQKYAIDFLQTGQKLLRQGMKEEAAAFFEQAGAHCEDHRSKEGHLNAELVRMHSLLLQKHSGELTADQDVNNTLEELSKEIEESEKWSKVKETTREVITPEFDHQFNLRLFLIFLIMMSIELKEIDTTFAAYDLYTKLSPYETEFHFLLNDGIQVFASKTLVTCNGKTAFQDVLVSSTIGPDESIAECPTPEEQVFRSLSYKTNTSSNGFLAACSSPVILDIDELLVLKRSVSLAFKECFQLKRFESEHEDVGTQIIVDLTSTTTYGHCSITSYGSRIELLPLCLTEDFQVGISQEQSIFEIQTSMWQDTKCMIFADEQTSSYMFKTTVLNLLQECRSDKTLTLAIQSHSISVAIRQPVKARLTLSHDKRSIKQRIKFVATATAKKTATALGIKGCDTQKYFEASFPKSVADVLSWPGIDTSAKKYQVAYQSGIHLEDPLDDPGAENNKVPPELKSSENDSKSSLKNSVLQCLIEVDELSRLLDEEPSPVQDDDNVSLGPIGDDKRFKDTASQTQTGQELIPREDNDVSLVDLNGGQSTFLGGQLYQDPISENSQQSETTSGDGSQSHCPTLKAPGCALIESSLQTHEESFTQRAEDSDETWMGKLLFESDRKSRRSLMAEFQRSLNKRKSKFKESSFNFEQNGDEVSIDSNRPYTSYMFSLKESQKTNDGIVDYIGIPHFQHQAKEKNQSSKFYSERECDSFEAIEVAKIDEGAPTVPKLIKDPESPAPSISNTQYLTNLKILSKSKRLKDGDSSLKDEESRVINENFKAIDESDYLVLEDTDVVDGPLKSCDFERESSNGQERFGKHYLPSSSRASPVMKPVCHDASFRYPYQDDGTFSTLRLPNVQAEERSRESTHALDTDLSLHDCEAQRKQIERDWLSGAHSFINSQDSSNPEKQLKSKLLENENNNSSERSLQNDFLIHSNHGNQNSDKNETTEIFRTKASEIHVIGKSIGAFDFSRKTQENYMEDTTMAYEPEPKSENIVEAHQSHPPMTSSDSFQAKRIQLSPFEEARRKTIPSFSEGERRHKLEDTVKIKGNGYFNLYPPLDLKKGTVFSSFSDHVSPDGPINGSFRKDQSNSDATFILNSTDKVDGSCELESDILNGPDERVRPSLYCSSGAIKDRQRRIPNIMSYDKTSFTSIFQGGDVIESDKASLGRIKDDFDERIIANEPIPNCSEKISQGFPSKDFSCKPEDILKEEAIAPVTFNDHGGARPKRTLNDSRKGMIIPTKTNSRSYPIFVARHINDDRNPDFCINAGNCDHASVEGHQQDDHNQYFLLSKDHGSFSFGEKDASCEEGYTQSCHVSDEGRISCPQRDIFVTKNRFMPQSSPLSQTERPSLSSRVCDEDLSLLPSRRYCVDEGDPVIPEPKSSFNSPYSQDAVNSVRSTMNKYDSSTKNIDCGLAQISTSAEDEVSLIEHSSGSLLGSLQQIMAQTVQLVASSVTPANNAQCTLQSVEKVGIQENARDFREQEVSIPSPINDSSNQEVFTQVNESTLGADREQQSIAIPVQETPRPVCSHYQRRCLVRFPCCGKFFPCHRCHNESDCTEDQARAINATHIRCTICYNEQVIDENSQRCGSCNSKMSEYFCATCKHFTSVDKNPFHCTKCGICRIHSDRSFHCDVCNVCLDKRLEGKHKCRPDSGHDECCICLEDAFSGCQILPCSHKVHKDCAIAMIQNGVRTCPICRHPLFGQLQTSPQ